MNTEPKKQNISFGFKTNSRGDLPDFSFSLLNREEKLAEFPDTNKKNTAVDLRIDILK